MPGIIIKNKAAKMAPTTKQLIAKDAYKEKLPNKEYELIRPVSVAPNCHPINLDKIHVKTKPVPIKEPLNTPLTTPNISKLTPVLYNLDSEENPEYLYKFTSLLFNFKSISLADLKLKFILLAFIDFSVQ
jgi:hypothetical protein